MSSSNFSSKASRLSTNYGSENFKETCRKNKEIISILPKREPHHPIFDLYQYEGFWYPLAFLESVQCMQENFKAYPSDIFLCSAPKTGITWLKALIFFIMIRHDFHDDVTNKVPQDCVPFLEMDFLTTPKLVDTKFSLLTTHLPYTILSKSILKSDNCKIIYICREPKDTFVSWWHFTHKIEAKSHKVPGLVTFDQEFKWFCQGKSGYGPYWDHVLGYWKASVERPERVFFLKYEDLKKDALGYVKKLAHFMNKPFSKEEEERGVPQEIVERCDFKSLSNLEVNKSGIHRPETTWDISNNVFFRKGEIDDWKNYLTEEMAKSIDDITHQKFQSSGLTFPSSI